MELVLSFLQGNKRPLIPEVFETFSLFHISILKADSSSGSGYLRVLLPAGASGDIATPCPASHTELLQQEGSWCVEGHWGYMICV